MELNIYFHLSNLIRRVSISWISSPYGDRTSDIDIARNSGFLSLLEPCDTVMAGGGFKIKLDLIMRRRYLAISPSAPKGT